MEYPYSCLQPSMHRWCKASRDIDLGTHACLFHRCWAIIRCTGRLPLQLFGSKQLPLHMAVCPLCGAPSVNVCHLFEQCTNTTDLFNALAAETSVPPRQDPSGLRLCIFREPCSLSERRHHIWFTASCVVRAVTVAQAQLAR